MENCIFCKIVSGEIPSYKIYEDEHCLAFLDVMPATKGHTLIIPKQHTQDFLTTPVEICQHMTAVAHMLANKLVSTLDASGINILNNNGTKAGQTVFHYHVHLIPRYDETDGVSIHFAPQTQDLEVLAKALTK